MATPKTEAGVKVPASAYAYIGTKDMPSTYKLRIDDAKHVAMAVAALGASGFRGQRVRIPEKDLPAVKKKVAAAYRKFYPKNDLPPILKAVDVKVNDTPVDDPGLLGYIVSAMASYFRNQEWNNEAMEDNSEYVEEQMFGTYEECPACGCDMTEGDPVCPQCGCDTSKIDPDADEDDDTSAEGDTDSDMLQKSVTAYYLEKSANQELRQATYIVLEPETEDAHGDVYSSEEIRKACHNFNSSLETAYLDHRVETTEMTFAESYIAPVDMQIGEEMVKKGSWLAVVQYEPELWEEVKAGKYTGLSIGAYANVEEIE